MSHMFNDTSIKHVPQLNTAAVTAIDRMFQDCNTLQEVPLFNTALVTNMERCFSGCNGLQDVPLFNTASVTNMQSMFSDCRSLKRVLALNATSVTTGNFAGIFNNCNGLASIAMTNIKFTFSVENCNLSSAALDTIYTNLPTVTSKTITVSGNYGTSGDTPSIATGKGWTVTG